MPLETASYINDLVVTNPVGTDNRLQGDDHLRLTKSVLKNSFPNMDAPMTARGRDVLIGTAVAARAAIGASSNAFRNRVINGDMAIDQAYAGASTTLTAGAALKRLCDMFYGYCTGANITAQNITTNSYNRERFTGAASNTGLGFATRLEAKNVDDLVSNTATLSCRLASTSITSVTWAAYYANSTNVFGTLASPTRTSIASGTFTINSTEATYSAQMSIPSVAHTGIEIVFTCGALLGSQTLDFGEVQLEKGAVATSDIVFEVVEESTQRGRCQWHYERIAILVTTTAFNQQMAYKPKRVAPILTLGSFGTGTGATFANVTQGGVTCGIYQSAAHSAVSLADVHVDAGLF